MSDVWLSSWSDFSLPRWRDDNIPISYVSIFAALQVDRPGHFFVAVKSATRNARDFLIIDDCLTILDNGDPSPDQRDVETLPFSWLARHFGRRCQETVYPASMMTGWFLDGVGFNLDFISTAQIDAAVGIGWTVELDVQLEILKL